MLAVRDKAIFVPFSESELRLEEMAKLQIGNIDLKKPLVNEIIRNGYSQEAG